jgi:hypothetical protein
LRRKHIRTDNFSDTPYSKLFALADLLRPFFSLHRNKFVSGDRPERVSPATDSLSLGAGTGAEETERGKYIVCQ